MEQRRSDAEVEALLREREELRRIVDLHRRTESLAKLGSYEIAFDAAGTSIWSEQVFEIIGLDPTQGPRSIRGYIAECVHPDDRGRAGKAFRRSMRDTRMGGSIEYRIVRPDGSVRHVRSIMEVVSASAGNVLKAIGTIQDLTEQRRLEESLLQAQKMDAVGRLAGGIAHDFNNLLTAILGYGATLLEQIPPPDPLREEVEQIRAAAERAAALTRQLLSFGRRQASDPRVLDVNEVVSDTERMLRRLIGERIALRTELAPPPAAVRMDRGQLQQLLVNLVLNARDAIPDAGSIRIATCYVESADRRRLEAQRFVELSVSDDGCGMDEETLDCIFEPFFTTKAPGKGTGLGLSVVYGIVKSAGGRIVVESKPGNGSVFRILLPRAEESVDATPARERERPSLPRGSERVLLVEDEDAVRRLVQRSLARAGYDVIVARDGLEALALVEGHEREVDLVVSDLMMPRLGGIDLLNRLRVESPGLRALLMSGYSHEGEAAVASTPGTAHLGKPFTLEALAGAVRRLLDGPAPAKD